MRKHKKISKETIIEILLSILSHFWKFIKRLYVFAYFFGVPYLISCSIALLIPYGLQSIGFPHSASVLLVRILLTIAPVVPTGVYTLIEAEDQYDECSMDLCFVVWIATVVYAWKIL